MTLGWGQRKPDETEATSSLQTLGEFCDLRVHVKSAGPDPEFQKHLTREGAVTVKITVDFVHQEQNVLAYLSLTRGFM